MKRKHHALGAFIVMALCLGAVGLYAFQSLANGEGVRPAFGWKPLTNGSAPPPGTIKEIERLDKELSSLAHPLDLDPPGVNLALFGYKPMKEREYTAEGSKMLRRPEVKYSLSLAFSAGTIGFCVIDGVFYQKDSVLPDGARIVKIEPHQVLIQKGEFLHWIPISDKVKLQHEKEEETGERA
jgi:hypothetical protein